MAYPAIDRLVGSHVMGWTRAGLGSWEDATGYHDRDWSPTSDWAATGEVMDKMESQNWDYEIDNASDVDGVLVNVGIHNGTRWWYKNDKSPRVAICLAALAAVGVPQSEIDAAMKETANG